MNIDEMIARAEKISLAYDEGGRPATKSPKGGCYRGAVIEGGFAFKFANSNGGVECNLSEWDFYAMTTDSIRKLLARPRYISRNGKVIVLDCLVMIQDVGRYGSDDYNKFSTMARDARKVLSERVKESHGLSLRDLHEGNFGLDDNSDTMLCTDYGAISLVAQCDHSEQTYHRDALQKLISK